MKNAIVLCVVYASLVSAGFNTPSPEKKDEVRVDKEGVVIGIEDDNGNTKVKISPQEVDHADEKGVFASAREKIKGVVPEVMKRGGDDDKFRAGEKMNSYTGRTKEAAEEEVKGGMGKVKDRVAQMTQKASERVEDAASEVSGKAKGKMREMKQGVKERGKAAEEQGKKGLKRVFWYLIPPVSLLHLVGLATAYGMCVWVTFGTNYALQKALPRQQMAMVQSRVNPLYFKAMASSVGMALVGFVMDPRRKVSPFRGFDLLASLVMILANLLYLEPRATKVLMERMRKEKEEGEGEGEGKKTEEAVAGGKAPSVSGMNSYSSMLNIATLACLSWHLANLDHQVHATEC